MITDEFHHALVGEAEAFAMIAVCRAWMTLSMPIVLLDIPFDTVTDHRTARRHRTAARLGPESIRSKSKLLRPSRIGLGVEPWTELQVADAGDIGVTPFDTTEAVGQIETAVRSLYDKADSIIKLGGGHAIAFPSCSLRTQRTSVALV
ncbi:arginase family protein [Rhodococcus qingshengii]|uniref:arginase family protein n=1 Tax=Rhodococcus qingshengii TaxID=334542 RepID=UPI0035DF54A9